MAKLSRFVVKKDKFEFLSWIKLDVICLDEMASSIKKILVEIFGECANESYTDREAWWYVMDEREWVTSLAKFTTFYVYTMYFALSRKRGL